jgi:predicted HTH transcriptional regulator
MAHKAFSHNRKLDYAAGNEEELRRYLREGEHQTQDFKFRIDSSLKIAKTLSAFANTHGGRLLIGVKDNGKVTGVDPEEEYYMIEGAAELYCKPVITFTAQTFSFEDKLVLEVYVKPSEERPHFAKEEDGRYLAYVRQDDENFRANRPLLKYLGDKTPKSKRKNLVAYGAVERSLFDLLGLEQEVSISKFARAAKIPIYRAEKTIALFLKWEIIGWKATEKGIRFYHLDKD